ncbi:hypothetical protein SAMN05519103_05201 [Rhizobiales bacterium GAS113]|nr:hypothetical protein SAMN05519103_05201 [Rhizobiales bacterium GAS113]
MINRQPEPKVCPECGHVFQGNGWDGIDAHWKAKHGDVMPYKEAWKLIKSGTYSKGPGVGAEREMMSNTQLEGLLGEDGIKRMLEQASKLWWEPEVERRKTAGTMPANFVFHAKQIVWKQDGAPTVRFNKEVRVEMQVRVNRAVQKGEVVLAGDFSEIAGFDLASEELDHAHFTEILINGRWLVSFNFLTGRAHCARLLSRASQFLEAAKFSMSQGASAPSVDNLFSASELAAKTHVILFRLANPKSKTHGSIHSSIITHRSAIKATNGLYIGAWFGIMSHEARRAQL